MALAGTASRVRLDETVEGDSCCGSAAGSEQHGTRKPVATRDRQARVAQPSCTHVLRGKIWKEKITLANKPCLTVALTVG